MALTGYVIRWRGWLSSPPYLFVIIRTGRTLPIAASVCDSVPSHLPPSPIVRRSGSTPSTGIYIAFQRCCVAEWCDMYIPWVLYCWGLVISRMSLLLVTRLLSLLLLFSSAVSCLLVSGTLVLPRVPLPSPYLSLGSWSGDLHLLISPFLRFSALCSHECNLCGRVKTITEYM